MQIRLYSEIDHTYLSIEAQCVSHHYPRWTATSLTQMFNNIKTPIDRIRIIRIRPLITETQTNTLKSFCVVVKYPRSKSTHITKIKLLGQTGQTGELKQTNKSKDGLMLPSTLSPSFAVDKDQHLVAML